MLYIGLMSGTSADGMDACIADISDTKIILVDALCRGYSPEFRNQLKNIALQTSVNVGEVMQIDQTLAEISVECVMSLLQRNQIKAEDIVCIGSHGHTLRHQPQPNGFSWQIGNPSWIAEHTGISCVSDFRRRDIAAGGEGAPLVPAFHQFIFAQLPNTAVVNIGGMANITLLSPKILGFDTGPGNALIDEWYQRITGQPYDADGAFAASGQVNQALLDEWKQHPYFAIAAPKSTGRELFSLGRMHIPDDVNPNDIARTLTELTAVSIAEALQNTEVGVETLLVCGGGVHNGLLMSCLTKLLSPMAVTSTSLKGINPDWVEAMAFAWLGKQCVDGNAGNVPEVTGARGPRVLGSINLA